MYLHLFTTKENYNWFIWIFVDYMKVVKKALSSRLNLGGNLGFLDQLHFKRNSWILLILLRWLSTQFQTELKLIKNVF